MTLYRKEYAVYKQLNVINKSWIHGVERSVVRIQQFKYSVWIYTVQHLDHTYPVPFNSTVENKEIDIYNYIWL